MAKILFTITLLLLSCLESIAYQGNHKGLRVGVWESPPFMHDKKGDDGYGYCFELVSTVLKRIGHKATPVYAPVISLKRQAEANMLDAICALPTELSNAFIYSRTPIIDYKWKLWIRSNQLFHYRGPSSYGSLRLISLKGWDYGSGMPALQVALKDSIAYSISGHDAARRAFRLIDTERADAIALDEPHAQSILMDLNLKNSFSRVETEKGVQQAFFAVSKSLKTSRAIIRDFEKAYAEALADGTIQKLKTRFKITQ